MKHQFKSNRLVSVSSPGWIALFAITFVLLFSSVLFADSTTGDQKVSGKIVDSETGEAVIGATVRVDNSSMGAISDLDGLFAIKHVPYGTYSLTISSVGYETVNLTDYIVSEQGADPINIILRPQLTEVEGITVTAKKVTNTSATLLLERKNATVIQDAISAEEIAKSGSGDAAEAMTKVTGASVVNNYVFIRGMGDKYASTKLNGSTLPSSDPDKQSASMDMMPTAFLDKIIVEKTFTPDKPGDFAGGSVNLGTKDYPEQRTLKVSMSSGYNTNTTGDEMLTQTPSSKDWLGYDDGYRDIPDSYNESFADQIREGQAGFVYVGGRDDYDSVAALANYTDQFSEDFHEELEPGKKKSPLNESYSVAYGDQWSLFERPLGIVASYNYTRKYSSYTNAIRGSYKLSGNDASELTPIYVMADNRGTEEVLWGGLLTLKYGIHRNHKLGFSFMRNQHGESTSRQLYGDYPEYVDPGDTINTRALSYAERKLQTIQFNGEHVLFNNIRMDWQASFADTKKEEPDTRFFTHQIQVVQIEDNETGDLYDTTVHSIQSSRMPDPKRYWRKLEENNKEYKANFTIPLGKNSKIKTGAFYLDVHREQDEDLFGYTTVGGFDGNADNWAEVAGLSTIDTNVVFQADTTLDIDYDIDLRYENGSWIVDTISADTVAYFIDTLKNDTAVYFSFGNILVENYEAPNHYYGDKQITAGYGMIELPLTSRLNFVGGLRIEDTYMYSETEDEDAEPGLIEQTDVLPSLNLIYKLNQDMNLRGSYGKTLARPMFREFTPATYEEFGVGEKVQGNDSLRMTLIDNVDLRWEWFISPGEVLAVSGFYKKLSDPIERVIISVNGNVTFRNSEQAEVYGLEVEFRRNLGHVAKWLNNFNLGGNFTFVKSEVVMDSAEVANDVKSEKEETRVLQGQSPYLINLDFSYDNFRSGTNISLYYNVFGRRLAYNALNGTPDVFETPRNQLDFIASQRVLGGPVLKLSVKNILGENVKYVYDDITLPNLTTSDSYVYQEYEVGTTVSLGVSYQIW